MPYTPTKRTPGSSNTSSPPLTGSLARFDPPLGLPVISKIAAWWVSSPRTSRPRSSRPTGNAKPRSSAAESNCAAGARAAQQGRRFVTARASRSCRSVGSTERDGASVWVSLAGYAFSRPLLLHPVVTALATDLADHASPVLEPCP